ncbi:hypothetical protein CK501_04215 [Halovibrio salipaludis]|uniref:DUF6843 domain-containing protein n=1 Tax=Halovibrio salipaludis TaxID=2032626 RepID=A0A2A2FA93_9GAMM|nr:hypothetical protein [Halovibrio salipaludis]PAU82356.1 hypothetical protein CK501_04215 [Halovibrio salipaludis]
MSTRISFATSTLTVISSLLALMTTGCSAEEQKSEIFLLPEGYQGTFYIVYNVPEGKRPTYEDGAPVYDIPEDGVLLTQADVTPSSVRSDKFFYESDDGLRESIDGRWTTSFDDTPEHRSDDQVYIFGEYLVEYGHSQDCRIYYSDFYVGTKSQALDQVGEFELFSEQGLGETPPEKVLEVCDEERN